MNISECFGQKSVNIYSGCYKLFRIYITRSVLDDNSASFIAVFGGRNFLFFFWNITKEVLSLSLMFQLPKGFSITVFVVRYPELKVNELIKFLTSHLSD